ncbi:MAG: beta strand repeat-containing protein [Phycisphaerae bacterium]
MKAHYKFQLCAFASLLLAASVAQATDYQWAGNSGNASNPLNWNLNSAPVGLNTDRLFFPGAFPYTVNFDAAHDPWIFNSLAFFNSSTVTVSSSNTFGITFDGSNPSILQNTTAPTLLNAPITLLAKTAFSGLAPSSPSAITTNALTITSYISGPGALLKSPTSPVLIYQTSQSPTFSGGTVISGFDPGQSAANQSTPVPVVWNFSASNISTPTSISFGTGLITLDRGEFFLTGSTQSIPANQTLSFTNNISITPNGGRLTASFFTDISNFNTTLPSINMTGNIALAGTLTVGTSTGEGVINPGPSRYSPVTYTGTVTLDQSQAHNPANSPIGFTTDANSGAGTTIAGNIVDDPAHFANNPLSLIPSGGQLTIAGTNNTYAHGTIIGTSSLALPPSVLNGNPYVSFGTVNVAPNSRLGTGNITLLSGYLHLTSPSNIAPSAAISGAGTLSIDFDVDPATLLAPNFAGLVSFNTTTVSTPLDLSTIGPAAPTPPRIGTYSNATYTATTLHPSLDHVYRLGLFGGNFNIANSVLVDANATPSSADLENVTLLAPNSYSGGTLVEGATIAAAPGSLGLGNITVSPGRGSLTLAAPNAYSPSASLSVAGTLILASNNSIPSTASSPVFIPGSKLNLGKSGTTYAATDFYPDHLPLNLNSTSVQLYANQLETIGSLSIRGANSITFPGNSTSATLTAPSLLRASGGLLSIIYNNTTAPSAGLQLATLPPMTNNMLPPYILYTNNWTHYTSDFVTWAANNTLAPVAYVPMPTDGGHGTEIVATTANVTIASNTTIYALKAGTNLFAANPDLVLTILSGGLTDTTQYSYTGSTTIDPNLSFGSAEAIIRAGNITFTGAVTCSNGLTLSGGYVHFASPFNQIRGPINIHGNVVFFTSIGDPSDASPFYFDSSSPYLSIQAPITTARPLTFAADGWIDASNGSLTARGPISSTDYLQLVGNIACANVSVLPGSNGTAILYVAGDVTTSSIQSGQLKLNSRQVGVSPTLTLLGPVASRISAVPSFAYTTQSFIDLTNSALVIQCTDPTAKLSALSQIRNLVKNGFNNGIVSSNLPANEAIAVIDNAITNFTIFRGQSVDTNSLLIAPELLGDANADAKVDLSDLSTLLNYFGQKTQDWTSGNFDGSPTINLTDLSIVLNHFGESLPTPSSRFPLTNYQSPGTPTPEPASLSLLALVLRLLTRRR